MSDIVPSGREGAAGAEPYAVEETAVQLFVNGQATACFHCTSEHLEEMALGWLLGEGLAADAADIEEIVADGRRQTVSARLAANRSDRTEGHPSGECGRWPSASDVPREPARAPAAVSRLLVGDGTLRPLFRSMFDRAVRREAGGGIHTGALVLDGEVRVVVEDVGRHNLVDKLIGLAARMDLPLHESLVLLSARVSGAIALKLWRTGVPAVATISVPTTMAREVADRAGIAIVGRSLKETPLRYPTTERD